jgi:hypothetical protein
MAEITLQQAYQRAISTNYLYTRNKNRWQFLMDSYQGGEEYRQGGYLQRYALESDKEYGKRLATTPLDNQVRGLVSLYISFLFREQPKRELDLLEEHPMVKSLLEDADLDGRSLNAFMKDVATWSSVFGHVWICVAKPNVGATSLAEELAQDVRPYLSLYIPLAVTDWTWERQPNGSYALSYIKLLEEVNDTESRIVEWTKETITTTVINTKNNEATANSIEPNGLGRLPFICAYAERGVVRGLGSSLIEDIADQQRMIYNELSEVYDSIRLDTHPSLVATGETNVEGAAAGQVITMPENMDPQLKPYVLQFQGGQISSIYDSINNRKKMIDSMGNVGAVRATETRSMSGIAIETEFQLLNARLSSIADNLELAEEQIWQELCQYLGTPWQGEIDYPDNFALHNTTNELDQLSKMKSLSTRPEVQTEIDYRIAEMLDIEIIEAENPQYVETSVDGQNCPIATQDIAVNLANRQKAIDTANYGPLNPQLPNTVFWAKKADMWNIDPATAKQSLCGNCSFFNQTSKILNCIDQGLSAGGATGDEWDSIGNGQLGYCEAFDFKCKSTRTCDAWVTGGPIVT